jgi:peptide/nickel transport system ATP-binding protein
MADSALRVEDLTVTYPGPVRAVDGITLEVAAGEIVALVGESGSGKSAAAGAVMGLLPETATVGGTVRIGGADVTGLGESAMRRIRGAQVSMVFQEPSTVLNPVETVGWQLGEALRAHRRIGRRPARTRAVELLELVGIPDAAGRVDSYPHQLSGGQKQRVAIALALANEPKLIIADEPTTALDVTVQAEILALLRQLRDKLGTAVLLITHNMGVVASLADRVVVLQHGRIAETGDVYRLFEHPTADHTRELLAAVPKLAPVAAEPEADTASDVVLDLDAVVAEYPGRRGTPPVRAVDGVSLTVRRGEVLGVVGESGSGKSTLGRIAVGLTATNTGRATVLGTDLHGISRTDLRALRRRIGVVFQDPAGSLDPRRTIGDSVGEPLRVHRAAAGPALRSRVAELLDAVRLPGRLADRRPADLSGGQRQRAGLARALALRPELLIADEPTSALDVSTQAAVLALFADLQRDLGFACLFISHDLAVVDEVATRIAVLRRGQLVESGTPATVLRTPADPYTRRLVDSIPVPDPAARR